MSVLVWGTDLVSGNPEINPNAISLQPGLMTKNGLKNSLLEIENMDDCESLNVSMALFKALYDRLRSKSVFRPWVKFPNGKTKEMFQELGHLKGFGNELSSLTEKAASKFVLDRDNYLADVWGKLQDTIHHIITNPIKPFAFWDWAKSMEWQGYRIPEAFVDEWATTTQTKKPMGWIKTTTQGKESKYSLISNILAYKAELEGKLDPMVNKDEINFSTYYTQVIPLNPSSIGYEVFGSFKLVSQLASFSDPVIALEDLKSRAGRVPLRLCTDNNLYEDMKNFVESITKIKNDSIEGYTWYTTRPMPFTKEMIKVLDHHHPDTHETIIDMWDKKGLIHLIDEHGLFIWEQADSKFDPFKFAKEILKDNQKQYKLRRQGYDFHRMKQVAEDVSVENLSAWRQIKLDVNTRLDEELTMDVISCIPLLFEDYNQQEAVDNFASAISPDRDKPDWLQASPIEEEETYNFEEEDEDELALLYG